MLLARTAFASAHARHSIHGHRHEGRCLVDVLKERIHKSCQPFVARFGAGVRGRARSPTVTEPSAVTSITNVSAPDPRARARRTASGTRGAPTGRCDRSAPRCTCPNPTSRLRRWSPSPTCRCSPSRCPRGSSILVRCARAVSTRDAQGRIMDALQSTRRVLSVFATRAGFRNRRPARRGQNGERQHR